MEGWKTPVKYISENSPGDFSAQPELGITGRGSASFLKKALIGFWNRDEFWQMCLNMLGIYMVTQSIQEKNRAFLMVFTFLIRFYLFSWFLPILLLKVKTFVLEFVNISHWAGSPLPHQPLLPTSENMVSPQLLKHRRFIIYLAHLWLPVYGELLLAGRISSDVRFQRLLFTSWFLMLTLVPGGIPELRERICMVLEHIEIIRWPSEKSCPNTLFVAIWLLLWK